MALKHGRGTALMHVLEHGLAGVEDLVLHACLENQAYDRQCEDHRAAWLYAMFKHAPTYAHFSSAIIAALGRDDDQWYAQQVCELAGLMGRDGDSAAAQALRDFVWRQPDGDSAGARALVALDGIPVVIEIARRIGRFVQAHPDEYADTLDYLTEETPYFDEAFAELKRHARDDTAIAAYVAKQQVRIDEQKQTESATAEQRAANRASHREAVQREMTFEKVLAAALAPHSESKYFFSKYGRYAREEDLDRILQRLAFVSNKESCLRLLWVFSRARLPRLSPRVWELASDSDDALRAAALQALSSVCDPRVGELARQRLRDVNFSAADGGVIELLVLNFQAGDDALILAALERLNLDDDDAHWIEMGARRVCTENNAPKSAEIAAWIYRTNPCTICRRTAIDMMLESGPLPEKIAEEWLHEPKK